MSRTHTVSQNGNRKSNSIFVFFVTERTPSSLFVLIASLLTSSSRSVCSTSRHYHARVIMASEATLEPSSNIPIASFLEAWQFSLASPVSVLHPDFAKVSGLEFSSNVDSEAQPQRQRLSRKAFVKFSNQLFSILLRSSPLAFAKRWQIMVDYIMFLCDEWQQMRMVKYNAIELLKHVLISRPKEAQQDLSITNVTIYAVILMSSKVNNVDCSFTKSFFTSCLLLLCVS